MIIWLHHDTDANEEKYMHKTTGTCTRERRGCNNVALFHFTFWYQLSPRKINFFLKIKDGYIVAATWGVLSPLPSLEPKGPYHRGASPRGPVALAWGLRTGSTGAVLGWLQVSRGLNYIEIWLLRNRGGATKEIHTQPSSGKLIADTIFNWLIIM